MAQKIITQEYFDNYAGRSLPYKKVWRDHSYFDECSKLFKKKEAPLIKSLCVLGASLAALKEFHKRLGLKAYGCEINSWAHKQIPKEYKKRIQCEDMLKYVASVKKKGGHFDPIFANSLTYLPEKKIAPFIRQLAHVCSYLHFQSSFKENYCPDDFRKTLKSYKWWDELIRSNGFERFVMGRARTYCWKSIK